MPHPVAYGFMALRHFFRIFQFDKFIWLMNSVELQENILNTCLVILLPVIF